MADEVEGFDWLLALMQDDVESLERDLKVPGFFSRIPSNPAHAWSAVIQTNALFEAAFVYLLNHYLGPSHKLEAFVDSLNQARRIDLIEALQLLHAPEVRFARTLNELRNKFAHRIANVNVRLDVYIQQLPTDKRESVCSGLDLLGVGAAMIQEYPSQVVLSNAFSILSRVHGVKTLQDRRAEDRAGRSLLAILASLAQSDRKDAPS